MGKNYQTRHVSAASNFTFQNCNLISHEKPNSPIAILITIFKYFSIRRASNKLMKRQNNIYRFELWLNRKCTWMDCIDVTFQTMHNCVSMFEKYMAQSQPYFIPDWMFAFDLCVFIFRWMHCINHCKCFGWSLKWILLKFCDYYYKLSASYIECVYNIFQVIVIVLI